MSLPSADDQWLDNLSDEEVEELDHRLRWVGEEARLDQLTPRGDWFVWLVLSGRGWGKTRTAAEDVAAYGLDNPEARLAVVAETFADGRDVCIEGESGLLSCVPSSAIKLW